MEARLVYFILTWDLLLHLLKNMDHKTQNLRISK